MFAPAVANLAAPTRAEINAGTILTTPGSTAASGIASPPSGFKLANEPIPTPNAAQAFDAQIVGVDRVDGNSAITFYDDDTSTTKRTALAKGTAGFIIRMPYGDTPTKRCEVWPVVSTGVNDDTDILNASGAATFEVGFSITSQPNQNAVIPA